MELAKNISEIISFVDILPFCGASLDLVPGSFNLLNGFSLMSRLAVRELNPVFYSFFFVEDKCASAKRVYRCNIYIF